MKKIKILVILLIVTVFSVINLNSVYGVTATLSPSSTNVTQGSTFTVRINFSNDIGGYNYTISYDTSKLTLVSGETSYAWVEGDQLPSLVFKANSTATGTAKITISGQLTDTNYNKSNGSFNTTVNVTSPATPGTTTTTTPAGSNTNLKRLVPNYEGLSPNFNPAITKYALTVPSTADSIKLTVATEDTSSKYWITGDESLKLGDNTVTVTVTAKSGAKKTYTIIVTKADDPEKANAYLNNLVIDGIELSPKFSAEVLEYDLGNVKSNVDKLTILPYAQKDGAKIEILGNESLKEGENTITIKVTAEDGKTTKEYTLKVNKEANSVSQVDIYQVGIYTDQNNLQNLGGPNNNSFLHVLWLYLKKFWLLLALLAFSIFELAQILYLYKKVNKDNKVEDVKEIKEPKEVKQMQEENVNGSDVTFHRRRNALATNNEKEVTKVEEDVKKKEDLNQNNELNAGMDEKIDDTYDTSEDDTIENITPDEGISENFDDVDDSNENE